MRKIHAVIRAREGWARFNLDGMIQPPGKSQPESIEARKHEIADKETAPAVAEAVLIDKGCRKPTSFATHPW